MLLYVVEAQGIFVDLNNHLGQKKHKLELEDNGEVLFPYGGKVQTILS